LKNGEVFGTWFPGTGPMIGVEVTSTKEGCRVTEVFPGSPAASMGVQVDDVVTKVEGQPVVSLEDIYYLLADNDPGQTIAVEIQRQGETIQAVIELQPRVP
jgi:S1-C subfamily serine protease